MKNSKIQDPGELLVYLAFYVLKSGRGFLSQLQQGGLVGGTLGGHGVGESGQVQYRLLLQYRLL